MMHTKGYRFRLQQASYSVAIPLLMAVLATSPTSAESREETETFIREMRRTSLGPVAAAFAAGAELRATVTGYSSTPDQTDDTPFVTAANTLVRDGVVAANFLPFGTKLKIPDYSGGKVYIVEDRMHRRFTERIDIWFPDRALAERFGKRELRVVIVAL